MSSCSFLRADMQLCLRQPWGMAIGHGSAMYIYVLKFVLAQQSSHGKYYALSLWWYSLVLFIPSDVMAGAEAADVDQGGSQLKSVRETSLPSWDATTPTTLSSVKMLSWLYGSENYFRTCKVKA